VIEDAPIQDVRLPPVSVCVPPPAPWAVSPSSEKVTVTSVLGMTGAGGFMTEISGAGTGSVSVALLAPV
jgi:hypothetical protein